MVTHYGTTTKAAVRFMTAIVVLIISCLPAWMVSCLNREQYL